METGVNKKLAGCSNSSRGRTRKNAMTRNNSKNLENEKVKSKQCTSKSTQYDERGRLREKGLDLCDCQNEKCSGCWYKCDSCGSEKCGAICRVNRKFCYEPMTFDGMAP